MNWIIVLAAVLAIAFGVAVSEIRRGRRLKRELARAGLIDAMGRVQGKDGSDENGAES